MSGFTAILQRDRRSLDVAALHRMNDAISHRGPDGSGCWIDGAVGLAHQMLRTTTESLDETQPAVNTRGNLVLVYEGLIDNAADIRHAARAARLHVTDTTDATAILLAYELWRDECVARLSGDFAFAIWDCGERRFFCARDPIGIRPFYYHLDARLFACGSELRQLLLHPGVRQDPNEGMAAEYLSNSLTSVDETLYRDVQRLPAGHSLSVADDRHTLRRYWHFDPSRKVRFKTDDEYAEALRAEIDTAVRACARTAAPLAIEVSGGLDSTSVAAMAKHLAARGELRVPVETFNVALPGFDCDEGEYVREFDRLWKCTTTRVSFELSTRSEFDASLAAHRDFPECPNDAMHYPVYDEIRTRGYRVLLGGVGGDESFTGHVFHYADLLKRMSFRALRRQMHDEELSFGELVTYGLRPLAPAPIRWGARLLRRGHPEWIQSRFANAVGLADRLRRPRQTGMGWQSRAQEEMFRDLTYGWGYHRSETMSRVLAEHGLEYRSPLLRLNVVEFGLAIPEIQRWRGSETKFALRRAMQGLLPERVRSRTDKADFGAVFAAAFSKLDSAPVFRSLQLTARGWLDGSRVREMHASLAAWQPGTPIEELPIWPLWMIFGTECWLTRAQAK